MENLTVDANILHSLLRTHEEPHEDAKTLWKLHKDGFVKITVTTRIDVDVPRDPLKSEIEELEVLKIPTIGRYGFSSYGGDYYASDDEIRLNEVLINVIFPGKNNLTQNDIADIDHLIGHSSSTNKHFITNEKKIFQKADELKKTGISVLSLKGFLNSKTSTNS